MNHPPGDASGTPAVGCPKGCKANTSRLGWETRRRALVHQGKKTLSIDEKFSPT
ncbi:MAG: hypothetical protein KME40_29405 [Komarekiella atlantica HA4396-MV6]|nr:hypothetical protein [Komarekiella atlantica HA4396-MV6]